MIKNLIKSQDFFSSLSDNEVNKLASIMTLHTYKKGCIHTYENSQKDELFFLVSGMARSYKIDKYDNEVFLYYIYENSIISDISDIDESIYTTFSNVELIEDSQILSVKYIKFKELFLDTDILCKAFSKEVMNRALLLQSLINREFIFDAVSKVSMMLYENLDIFNKLKRHDISAMLHIQPATLSRVLNRLKRKEIIDITHGKVIIDDLAALQKVFKDGIDE